MSVLDRKKTTLSPLDIKRLAAAVAATLAGHTQAHHDPAPPAAPQSPRMRALMRLLPTPMPAAERLSASAPGPAATAHRDEAKVAPRPAKWPIPLTETPVAVTRDANGRIASIQVGDLVTSVTQRDAAGQLLAFECLGFKTRITRRDANGSIAGMVTTPPTGR